MSPTTRTTAIQNSAVLIASPLGPSGVEPLTSSLSGTRSNQLSYEPFGCVPSASPRGRTQRFAPPDKKTTGSCRWSVNRQAHSRQSSRDQLSSIAERGERQTLFTSIRQR